MFETHSVAQILQKQDESLDAFVSQAARVMRDYTNRTGFEAGGWLCAHPRTGMRAMTIFSTQSQISVSAGIRGCPLGGYRLTDEFMHSHTTKPYVLLTEQDLHGYPMHALPYRFRRMRIGDKVRVGASGGRFSSIDIRLGPGYLVHGDHLYYQNGGKSRLVRLLQEEGDTRQQAGPTFQDHRASQSAP